MRKYLPVLLLVLVILGAFVAVGLAAERQPHEPPAVFPAPGAVTAGVAVRLPEGVASWDQEAHRWTFCPLGWTDIQCGS